MKKILIGVAVFVGGAVVLHRFGPAAAERGMKKCHEMMDRQSGPSLDTAA